MRRRIGGRRFPAGRSIDGIERRLNQYEWEYLLKYQPRCPVCGAAMVYIGKGVSKGVECAIYACANRDGCPSHGRKRVGVTRIGGTWGEFVRMF